MNQPTTQAQAGFSPPWFLIIGLVLGIAFVAYIVWDSSNSATPKVGSGNVVEITQATWQREVVQSDVPVVVDFTASWCPPCKAFAPIVEAMAERYKGKVKVARFDVGDRSFSKGRKLAARYDINTIPRTFIFKGGDEPRQELMGLVSEAELVEAIERVLAGR